MTEVIRSEAEKNALDNILPAWGNAPEDISELTVARLDALTESAFQLKFEREKVESELKRLSDLHNEVTRQIQEYLNFHGKEKYVSPSGTINIIKKLSFTTPKTEEQKKAYFQWLQNRGAYWSSVGVNSNTLNAMMKDFWNTETNSWLEKIPGIEEPKNYERVQLTKNR